LFRDIRKNKVFNRRTFLLGAIQTILGSTLVARLGYLQIVKHDQYSIQSDSNRIKPFISPAPRGLILDRFGKILAENNTAFRLFLYLGNRKENLQTVQLICEILNFSSEKKEAFLNKLKNSRRRRIITLIDDLQWEDLAKIESNYHLLSSISVENGVIRKYPFPFETAHFLGYVSLPSEKEIDENEQNLFMHPDFRIGKAGVEKSFDSHLRGSYGVKYVEVNVHEVPIRELSSQDAIEGSRLHLTIDFSLQKFAMERMSQEVASAVVIDVESGEILTFASTPSFDSNRFIEGVSFNYWNQLNSDPHKPLLNKPIAALYPPGSTFKIMTALAALEAGIKPEFRVSCNGTYQFGKRTFHCWKKEGHGSLDLVNAIMHSCNTYFYTIANQIGAEKIAVTAKKFGYGEKFDINLSGAKFGVAPNDEWKRAILKQPWMGGDTLNVAIGQGFVLANPLQMALVTARIANGVVPIKPHLVRNQEIFTQFYNLQNKKIIDQNYLKLIQEGMYRVVNIAGGTAFGKKIDDPNFIMAGKTGTSQVISKRESEMTAAEKLIRANQNHAIFVGFAPFEKPQYAISVVVEHGQSGSQAAAPIARDILIELNRLNNERKNKKPIFPK